MTHRRFLYYDAGLSSAPGALHSEVLVRVARRESRAAACRSSDVRGPYTFTGFG